MILKPLFKKLFIQAAGGFAFFNKFAKAIKKKLFRPFLFPTLKPNLGQQTHLFTAIGILVAVAQFQQKALCQTVVVGFKSRCAQFRIAAVMIPMRA